MKNGMKASMYGKVGTIGLTILMVAFTIFALMRPDVGLTVIVIWCLLMIIFKLDILTLEMIKLAELNKGK
ncbi:MAG: hypothetical protein ISS46_00515 [Candidatus Omnitrophica bacterium]|nr:hypothetical protein [Candidatus Omnitrophota bacterium]